MSRTTLFAVAMLAAVICLIIAAIYWVGGTPLGHHIKHGIVFVALALLCGLFALANRPARAGAP